MKGKIIGFLVCTIFITTIIPFSVTSNENEGSNIIYVDDDGTADYTSIQDAIDNALDGDTINVMPGIYYEFVKIDKSIKLIGQDKHTTIIDGMNKSEVYTTGVVDINANYVEMCRFTIRNITCPNYGILVEKGNNVIADNTILSNNPVSQIGIYVCSEEPFVNKQYGFNSIYSNTVSGGRYGICVYGQGNTVENNVISDCIYSGISIDYCKYSTIKGNIITKNEYGILIVTAFYNTISNNHIENNEIGILSFGSSKNKIVQNNLIDNLRNALVTREILGFIRHFVIFPLVGFHPLGRNTWYSNYYSDISKVPYQIPTQVEFMGGRPPIFTYYLNFDWNPASEPYDIPIVEGEL